MNHIFDTEDEGQNSTQLKFLKTLIDKLIKGRKHPTGAPPSSGMTNSCLKIHFLAMKKMKNSHPHVPQVQHVQQVRPVGQDPQAPFRHGIHKGQNTQRVLRHHLGRPTSFMVSSRTILRIQIRTYIILCLRTVWRQSEKKIKITTRSTRCTRTTRTTGIAVQTSSFILGICSDTQKKLPRLDSNQRQGG